MESIVDLREFIEKIIKDYRKKRVQKGLVLGLLSGALLVFMIYFLRIYINFNINVIVTILIFPLSALIGGALAFFWPINVKEVIARADKEVSLEEMLITYYEYNEKENQNRYLPLLKERLLSIISNMEIEEFFHLNIKKELRVLGIVLVCFLFLSIWIDFTGIYQLNLGGNRASPGFSAEERPIRLEQEEESGSIIGETQDSENDFGMGVSDTVNTEFNLSELGSPSERGSEETNLDDQQMEKAESSSEQRGDEYSPDNNGEDSSSSQSDDDLWNVSDEEKDGSGEEAINNKDQSEENDNENTSEDNKEDSSSGDESNNKLSPDGEGKNSTQGNQPGENQNNNGEMDSREGSEEAGANPGSMSGSDDFQGFNTEHEDSKIQSKIQNENYDKYIEELMRPDLEGQDINLSDEELMQYRDYILNSLSDERIPANYKEMVREYFNKIIQE